MMTDRTRRLLAVLPAVDMAVKEERDFLDRAKDVWTDLRRGLVDVKQDPGQLEGVRLPDGSSMDNLWEFIMRLVASSPKHAPQVLEALPALLTPATPRWADAFRRTRAKGRLALWRLAVKPRSPAEFKRVVDVTLQLLALKAPADELLPAQEVVAAPDFVRELCERAQAQGGVAWEGLRASGLASLRQEGGAESEAAVESNAAAAVAEPEVFSNAAAAAKARTPSPPTLAVAEAAASASWAPLAPARALVAGGSPATLLDAVVPPAATVTAPPPPAGSGPPALTHQGPSVPPPLADCAAGAAPPARGEEHEDNEEHADSAPTRASATAPADANPDAAAQVAANVVSGSGADSTIQELCNMGFGRPEAERITTWTAPGGLEAAFDNLDRGVENLITGFPEGLAADPDVLDRKAADRLPQIDQSVPQAADAIRAGPQLLQQHGMQPGAAGGGGGAPPPDPVGGSPDAAEGGGRFAGLGGGGPSGPSAVGFPDGGTRAEPTPSAPPPFSFLSGGGAAPAPAADEPSSGPSASGAACRRRERRAVVVVVQPAIGRSAPSSAPPAFDFTETAPVDTGPPAFSFISSPPPVAPNGSGPLAPTPSTGADAVDTADLPFAQPGADAQTTAESAREQQRHAQIANLTLLRNQLEQNLQVVQCNLQQLSQQQAQLQQLFAQAQPGPQQQQQVQQQINQSLQQTIQQQTQQTHFQTQMLQVMQQLKQLLQEQPIEQGQQQQQQQLVGKSGGGKVNEACWFLPLLSVVDQAKPVDDQKPGTSGLWQGTKISDRACARTLEGHTNLVRCLSADFDTGPAVSGSWDQSLRVWRLVDEACPRTI